MYMDEKDQNKGLNNNENDTQGEQPNPENDSQEEDDLLKNGENEDIAARADNLLDGTSKDKNFTIPKKKYDEMAGKAKLYETHSVLLDRVLKNPELVENLLETKEKGDLEGRLLRLEEERKEDKRKEIRQAVQNALSTWDDFEKSFSDIQPIADSLYKQGLPYAESLRRGYLAVHPEAAEAESKRIAQDNMRAQGQFSSRASFTPKTSNFKTVRELSTIEKRNARAMGKSDEEYVGLLQQHDNWLRTHGFFHESLDKPLSEEL